MEREATSVGLWTNGNTIQDIKTNTNLGIQNLWLYFTELLRGLGA